MAGEKRAERLKDPVNGTSISRPDNRSSRHTDQRTRTGAGPESDLIRLFRHHALSLIIFLVSLFFIITITNPALYLNDEWITANQLHQLDIGHQVTYSEGKYGVTENGTISAYFTSRQNVLMYSLALPVSALPAVKLFGLFGDNFRIIVIMIWSLCLVLIALIADSVYPGYAKIRGIRIFLPVVGLALLLFMGNVFLYRQFPFLAPDAPFEVAALVFTNNLLFALLVTVVFEISRLILEDTRMALFGTIACISCSSYIFWAAAAKDHILSTTVLAFIIFFYIRYLSYGRMKDAFLAFVCSGLLIWVRPEIGFFVTIFSGLFFSVPRIRNYFRKETSLHQCLQSLLPAAGVFLGSIPFFVNNLLISHNPLIPVFDLPRSIQQSGSAITLPLSWDQVMITPAAVNEVSPLDLPATVSRLWDMVSHAMLSGFTVDNLGQGFIGLMTFPKNDSIGFFIMCPLFFIALIALLLWYTKILDLKKERKTLLFFLVIMGAAVFFSYATKFSSMNTSHGIIPDMRYLSPAYIPAGLISVLILSRTPVLKNYDELVKTSITGSVILAPLLILVMIVVHPFSDSNAGYFSFFEFIILCELVLCSLVMILFRFYRNGSRFLLPMLPCLIVLVIITAFSFQFMLTSFYSMVEKFNGYPFWIPLIREGFNMLITVNYLPPV